MGYQLELVLKLEKEVWGPKGQRGCATGSINICNFPYREASKNGIGNGISVRKPTGAPEMRLLIGRRFLFPINPGHGPLAHHLTTHPPTTAAPNSERMGRFPHITFWPIIDEEEEVT